MIGWTIGDKVHLGKSPIRTNPALVHVLDLGGCTVLNMYEYT
jgi:hypothetical protein